MRNWMKVIRENESLTQSNTAQTCGISQSHYCEIETGKANPHPDKAKVIAKALNFEKYGIDWTAFYQNDVVIHTEKEKRAIC